MILLFIFLPFALGRPTCKLYSMFISLLFADIHDTKGYVVHIILQNKELFSKVHSDILFLVP